MKRRERRRTALSATAALDAGYGISGGCGPTPLPRGPRHPANQSPSMLVL